MDNKDKNKVSGSAGGSLRERTTATTQTTTSDITQKASFMGLPYDRWIMLIGLLFALLLCLGFFVRCGANPVTPVATAVPPAPAATATAVKPAATNTALPATAVPPTAVPPTAVPPTATAVALQLPKITLPKITLPALPFLAGAAGQFLEGTGDPNAKYTVYDGDKAIGTVTADASGKWKFELPKFNVGDHSIKLVPLGADGKEIAASAASVVLSIKEAIATAVASLPKINLPKITLPALPFLAGAAGQFVEGTGDPNTKYTVYDGDKAIGTVTTDASGKWKFELPILSAGDHSIKVVPMGADGKEVPASASAVVVKATADAAPAAAAIPAVTPLKGDTVSQGGVMRGTGTPGSTVMIYEGDKMVGTAKVDAKGNWSWKVPLDFALGDHSFKVATQGADGKAGAFSAEYKFKVTGPVTLPVTGEAQTAPLMWVVVALLGAAALVFGARKAQTQAK